MYCYITFVLFHLANDKLDANTAEEFELCAMDYVGPVTAREMCNKRPYDDEEDLYRQVRIDERAKKKIKVVKNINEWEVNFCANQHS